MNERFSDEHLNAYLDGELETSERLHLMETVRRDPELASRLCQLQKVKEMVQLAYTAGCEPIAPPAREPRRWWMNPAIAASVLFLIGLIGGWVANLQLQQPTSLLAIARNTNLHQDVAASTPWRLMLHVDSNDRYRYKIMLRETEHLLRSAAEEGRPVKIEIVTNGPGLTLLSDRDDPITRKLQKLAREFDNLELRACEQAIRRYRIINGKDIELIPEAGTVRSAMHEVIKRQKEGWAYINI